MRRIGGGFPQARAVFVQGRRLASPGCNRHRSGMTETYRPRRSVLYVPASNDKALAKIAQLACDAVIIDLEDAVAPADKIAAREKLAGIFANRPDANGRRCEMVVRVNALSSEWGTDDLAAVAKAEPDGILLAKVDTPLWQRNPYLLDASTWGVVYVLHGASALLILTLTMTHVYFSLLPEKRAYLRAMIGGQMTREEAAVYHDPARWSGQRKDDPKENGK